MSRMGLLFFLCGVKAGRYLFRSRQTVNEVLVFHVATSLGWTKVYSEREFAVYVLGGLLRKEACVINNTFTRSSYIHVF